MCGIAAVIAPHSLGDKEARLFKEALARIRHRGYKYDETGAIDTYCLMGANRLEIVDRAGGVQPFITNDRSVMVVFNGEIYNYRDLRAEIEKKGGIFSTDCDTEVILEGYTTLGISWLLENLRGMFAILIYDKRQKLLYALRDPFGIKPLYWAELNGTVLFASEIKALTPLKTTIHELGPGHTLKWQGGKFSFSKYFDPALLTVEPGLTFETAAQGLRKRIANAVKRRVTTDLPVAVLLGGIDSGIILSQAVKFHHEVKAFTIARNKREEDAQFAMRFCEELDVPLSIIEVSEEELLRCVPKVIECIETFEPNHVRGGTLSYLLSKAIHEEGYRIALCGEGADELFGGYAEYAYFLETQGEASIEKLRQRFVKELYKTQLKRVDRTSMAFTLEVRVPYLDLEVATFSLSLPGSFLLKKEDTAIIEKYILRQAFRDELPDYLVHQRKRVLSEGAGFGTNAEEGPFFAFALSQLTEREFLAIKTRYPQADLKNREEAYYFKIFEKLFPVEQCPFLLERPFVNRKK